jgi:hypothetical protein
MEQGFFDRHRLRPAHVEGDPRPRVTSTATRAVSDRWAPELYAECGDRDLNLSTVLRIADVLGVKASWLVLGDGRHARPT